MAATIYAEDFYNNGKRLNTEYGIVTDPMQGSVICGLDNILMLSEYIKSDKYSAGPLFDNMTGVQITSPFRGNDNKIRVRITRGLSKTELKALIELLSEEK